MGTNNIIKIQSLWRGFYVRKNNSKLKDGFTKKLLISYIKKYIQYINFQKEINITLRTKKIRIANFPSEISENIVKFVLFKKFKYKFLPIWDTKKGDLVLFNRKIEVKASIDLYNSGPSSFGPVEIWDYIYFVDCKDMLNLNFKVFEIPISNYSEEWKNIKVNKDETFIQQCNQKRRPRILFKDIEKQIGKQNIKLIFEGNISSL